MKLKKEIKRFFTLKHKANNGFTLVELIVVIAILGVLGGVAVPVYSGYVEKANRSADDQLLATINKAYAVACLKNGDDMTKLTSAKMDLNADPRTVNVGSVYPYGSDFGDYYLGNEGSVFKYYDKLYFNAVKDIFEGRFSEEVAAALKNDWDGSSFEPISLNKILGQFDGIGDQFSGFSWTALNGFPPSILNALGLGDLSDITDDEAVMYLTNLYGDDWAGMSDDEKSTLILNYKGNASTMQILTAAGNYTAEEIVENIGDFVKVMGSYDENDSTFRSGLIDYYNKHYGYEPGEAGYTDDYDTAKAGLNVPNMLSGDQVFALANSDMKNSSGAGTLGAMYAIAMAYYGGEDGHNYGYFDVFQDAMRSEGFLDYLGISFDEDGSEIIDYTNAQAMKDIEAYQSFAKYLSTGDIEMNDAEAFVKLLTYMTDALS